MKYFVFFVIFSLPVLAQNKELQVKGIKIGTYYSTVTKKLGKPSSFKKNGEYYCFSGTIRTARYDGLIIDFIESNDNQKLFVARVKVNSPKWSVLGIKVGTDLKNVRKIFSGKLRKENGFDVLGGINGDGYGYFYFRKSKLIKIAWELNPC